MDTPFIVTSVVVTTLAVIIQCFSLRQVIYDFIEHQRLRPLIVSHYFTYAASLIICIVSIDSQGGLGIYSQASVLFLLNIKSFLLIASAFTLAVGFVESHKLMTIGPAQEFSRQLFIHIVLLALGLILFIVLALTHYSWLNVVAKISIAAYSVVVSVQVITSTVRVRRVLMEEHKRNGNYAVGIRKLTRLIILVVAIMILGNVAIVVGLASDIALAQTNLLLSESKPPFVGSRILGDASGLIAVSALLMGAWNIANPTDVTPAKKTRSSMAATTTTSTAAENSKRVTCTKETIRLTNSGAEMCGTPTGRESNTHSDLALKLERELSTGSTFSKDVVMDNMSRDASHEDKLQGECTIIDVSAPGTFSFSSQ
jgi:hypothetical protein